ncbi:MAG: hypothetical protein VXX85_06915 [Candidatus Margulisiibacteriota bacterium]|nr:hypothetical protein [Candidatus Margulisiibacteriota bacterium]
MPLDVIIFYLLSLLGAVLTIVIAYGSFVKKRQLVLNGLFYYSFLPIIGETMGYLTTQLPYHFLFIALFSVQLLLASIKNTAYDPKNDMLTQYAKRIGGAFILINAFAAIFILVITTVYPIYLGIFHSVISLSLIYALSQRVKGTMSE